jgi:hypothetical protein
MDGPAQRLDKQSEASLKLRNAVQLALYIQNAVDFTSLLVRACLSIHITRGNECHESGISSSNWQALSEVYP